MRVTRLTLAGLVLAVLAGGGAAVAVHRLGGESPVAAPVPSPSPTRTPVLAPYTPTAAAPTVSGIAAALASALRDPALGGPPAVTVLDATDGSVLYDRRGADPVPPASTTKLATATAALTVLGPLTRLTTRAVLDGSRVVLVGGGDPTLAGPRSQNRAAARLGTLATAAAAALRARGIAAVSVGYDATLFHGPTAAPGWHPVYFTEGDVAPVTALEIDEGRQDPADPDDEARVADPAAAAAQAFAALLARAGVAVRGTPQPEAAPADAVALARVDSPPVGALVERMLAVSDNDLAEALARQVALREGEPATFAGAAAAVTAVLARLGLPASDVHLVDGSGLSRVDRLTTRLLAGLLALAASPAHPALRPVVTSLPVAGFSGTLDERYRASPAAAAAGDVRAKTGTLSGVSSLAGLLVDRAGRLLTFAVVADHAPSPDTAEAALDRLAARLAACGCR